MSYPPGTPDPSDPGQSGGGDPWATPPPGQSHEQPPTYAQPAYGYPQPGYGYPPYGQPGYGYVQPTNGKATASLWTGVGAIVLSPCCGLGVLGVVPIVLGAMGRREIRAGGGQQGGSGLALAGIITGAIAVALSLVVIALLVVLFARDGGSFSTYDDTRV